MSADHDPMPPRFGEADKALTPQPMEEGGLEASLGARSLEAVSEEHVLTGEVLDTEPKTPEEAIVAARYRRIKRIMDSRVSEEEKEAQVKAVLTEGLRAEVKSNQLDKTANHDDLTGALRRGAFDKKLEAYFASGQRFGFVTVDLNLFKRMNDTYGHPVGDEILKIVPVAIRQNTREDDPIGRLGGDEFGVIVPLPSDISAEDANAHMAERSRQINNAFSAEVNAQLPVIKEEATMSIGWVLSDEGSSPEVLYDLADRRMYLRKQAGRRNDPIEPSAA